LKFPKQELLLDFLFVCGVRKERKKNKQTNIKKKTNKNKEI